MTPRCPKRITKNVGDGHGQGGAGPLENQEPQGEGAGPTGRGAGKQVAIHSQTVKNIKAFTIL
jgi:hypothetical protein